MTSTETRKVPAVLPAPASEALASKAISSMMLSATVRSSVWLMRIMKLAIFLVVLLSGCRAGWQHPDRVIASLRISPGDHVADIGAGDGYFTFLLADAVGPEGMVYAVEVTENKVRKLSKRVERDTYANIEVILGKLDDPLLPDGTVDLVFLCNTYHHIENRPAYFSQLRTDLRQHGRVAIIDLRDDLSGIPRLFVPSGHWTAKGVLYEEMEAAGYVHMSSFSYLPVQNFEIFSARDEGSTQLQTDLSNALEPMGTQQIAEYVGHVSSETTRLYTHFNLEESRKRIERLAIRFWLEIWTQRACEKLSD